MVGLLRKHLELDQERSRAIHKRGGKMTVEQFHKIRTEYGIYSFQIPTKEMLERITEEDLRKTFSNFKKLVDKMKGKKQSKE